MLPWMDLFLVPLSRKHGGLFSDFDSILGSDAGSALKRPRPEELPMSEDDMVFGSVTPALAEMLPESEKPA